jgi:aspartyl-tRNA(Asn)/glutamyl-tRNA(Gln) amidotransferase subunit C
MKQTFNIPQVAKLAGIKLSQSEIDKFQKQLTEILGYVGKISKLRLTKIEPTSQVTGLENVSRKDETSPSFTSEKATENTRHIHNNFFKTKAIFG